MKKSLLLFYLFAGLFFKISYSQAPLAAATNPNFVHDKIQGYFEQSDNVKLPDSIITIFKRYAHTTNRFEPMVLKHTRHFQVLCNDNLPIADRIYACKFFIENNKPYNPIPPFLLNEFLVILQAKIK